MRTMKLYQRRWLLLRRLALVIMMGSLAACDVHILAFFFGSLLPPGGERPDCRTSSVTVAPGTCAMINNPCGGSWSDVDGFRLRSEPAGISVRTRRLGNQINRDICATADVAIFVNQPVNYLYTDFTPGFRLFGTGIIYITTGNPFTLAASATPPTINLGQTSQLLATPTGGVPPYTFVWLPVSTLNQINIANPIATPTGTTIYGVTATDALGATAIASVIVNVASTLVVTASPATINPGESSQLNATATGGSPPYTYAWVPTSSLSDPTAFDPVATPVNTTTYVVTVTDALGAQMSGSVTVTVNLIVGATATPDTITAGNSSQLQAVVQGGTLPYSFSWSPAGSLNDSTIANPVATPGATTAYTVVVTDGAGNTANASTTVTVTGGRPVACFTYTNDTVSQFINLDANCSTGGVVRYEWDFSFEPGNPDLIRTTPIAQWEYGFGSTGTITLRVFDAGGASASTALPFP